MNKLAQWLDIGHYVREPAHVAAGLAVSVVLGSVFWANLSTATVDTVSGSDGNRLVLSNFSDPHLLDRPTRLTELAELDHRAGVAATPVRALGDRARRLEQERRCLAVGIYFEARGESHSGQVAVADVIMNRVASKDYPNTICGVVFQGSYRQTGCQFSFTCDGESDRPRDLKPWLKAQRVASTVTMRDDRERQVAENVLHYHADYVEPVWASHMYKVAKIGRHIFYARTRSRS
ncbi:MAG: cell wall hydrolase [Rhodobiaceae bacterium]|nr:cell wall hydrolase [Rhodobiaceae bacterium]